MFKTNRYFALYKERKKISGTESKANHQVRIQYTIQGMVTKDKQKAYSVGEELERNVRNQRNGGKGEHHTASKV
jgi:hypothetical protein